MRFCSVTPHLRGLPTRPRQPDPAPHEDHAREPVLTPWPAVVQSQLAARQLAARRARHSARRQAPASGDVDHPRGPSLSTRNRSCGTRSTRPAQSPPAANRLGDMDCRRSIRRRTWSSILAMPRLRPVPTETTRHREAFPCRRTWEAPFEALRAVWRKYADLARCRDRPLRTGQRLHHRLWFRGFRPPAEVSTARSSLRLEAGRLAARHDARRLREAATLARSARAFRIRCQTV
jgi:hypothetical protein